MGLGVIQVLMGMYRHLDATAWLGMAASWTVLFSKLARNSKVEVLRILSVFWVASFLAAAKRPRLVSGPAVRVKGTVDKLSMAMQQHELTSSSPRSVPRGAVAAQIAQRCPSLHRTFWPNLLGNGLLHSVICAVLRSRLLPKCKSEDETLNMEDGGSVRLVWFNNDIVVSQEAPVVVVFPGNLGGSDASYLQGVLAVLRSKQWRAVVFNRRGCGKIPLTSPRPQNFVDFTDTRVVLQSIRARYPQAPLFGLGFSLGGNYLVRTLAWMARHRHTDTPTFSAAVVLGVPYNITKVSHWLAEEARLVEYALLCDIRDMVRRNADILRDGGVDVERVLAADTYRDAVRNLHCRVFGYTDLDIYLEESSSESSIAHVDVPLLCVHADDDPVVPTHSVPLAEFERNPHVLLAHMPSGGHHGFVGVDWTGPSWSDKLIVEWMQGALDRECELDERSSLRKSRSYSF